MTTATPGAGQRAALGIQERGAEPEGFAALEARVDWLLQARAAAWPSQTYPAREALRDALGSYARVVEGEACRQPLPKIDDALLPTAARFQDDPVFVVGYYKSGTTLVRNLLDGHRHLVALPSEGRYYSLFVPRHSHLDRTRQVRDLGRLWVGRLIDPQGQPPFWLLGRSDQLAGNPYVEFLRYLRAWAMHISGYGAGDLLLALVLANYTVGSYVAGQCREPEFWLEKTPTNEFRVPALVADFPGARFIHVARDPRAVVSARRSVVQQTGEAPYHLLGDLYWLNRSMAVGKRNLARLGSARYHILRYEDLVREPEAAMTRLAGFIGIEYSPTLLVPTECSLPAVANSAYARGRVAGGIHRTSLKRYEEELSREDLALISGVSGRWAEPYGYQFARPSWYALSRGLARASAASLCVNVARLRARW